MTTTRLKRNILFLLAMYPDPDCTWSVEAIAARLNQPMRDVATAVVELQNEGFAHASNKRYTLTNEGRAEVLSMWKGGQDENDIQ